MNKILKYAGFFFSGLLGLLVLVIVILKLIPDTQYKSWITSAVESSTGRGFSMESLELDFGRSLRLSVSNVKLNNAAWAQQANMLSIGYFHAELPIWPLFSGRAEIRTQLDHAEIIAQSNESGVANWDLSAGLPADETSEKALESVDQDTEDSGLAIRPVIRELSLNDIKWVLLDANETNTRTALLKQLLIETPKRLTHLMLRAEIEGTPVELSGDLGDIDAALDRASTALKLNGAFDQNKLNISGEWGPILPATNLNLLFDLQVPSTSSIAAIAGYEMGDIGVLDFSARVRATHGAFAIEDIVTLLDGEQTQTSISGGIDDVRLMQGVDLGIELNTAVLALLVKELNIELPVPIPPEVQLSAQVEGGKNGLSINKIKILIRDEGLELTLNGAINNVLSSRQIDADFSANFDSLSALSKYAGMELPTLGAIALSGRLASEGEALSLNALKLGLSAENISLDATGTVKDLLTVSGIDAQIEANIASLNEQNISELSALLETYGVELPVDLLPQSLKIHSAISGNLENLRLSDIRVDVIDEGLSISVTGGVDNVLVPEGVSAELVLKSESIAAFSKYAGSELPDLGPLEATASLVSENKTYRLERMVASLSADVLQAKVEASVADLLKINGISAQLSANTDSLSSLSNLAQTTLPVTDPVQVQATLKGEDLEQARLDVNAETTGVAIAVSSILAQIKSADDLTIDVSVQAESLSDFDKFLEQELPQQGPLDLSASINIQPGTYTLSELKLQLDNQSATGEARLVLSDPDNSDSVTLLHGQLDIAYLNLAPLLPAPEDELAGSAPEDEVPTEELSEGFEEADEEEEEELLDEPLAPSERLLSSEPILFEQLHDYDIDLAINAKTIDFGKTSLRDFQLNVLLKNGLLDIGPLSAFAGDGNMDGHIQLDGRNTLPALDARILLNKMPMPNIGGKLDFHLDLEGEGQSIAELLADFDGQLLIVASDGVIDKSIASRFGSGLLSFSGNKQNTKLECAILRVDIVDGVANFKNKLAAQLTEVTWRGGGEVDFNTERLKADIAPKPRKGIPVSVGGSLAGLVKLGGTLKNPRVVPDYSDAALKYGKYAAYVSTGGLSLLAEIVANKLRANQDVCAKILDGTVFDSVDKAAKKNNPPR